MKKVFVATVLVLMALAFLVVVGCGTSSVTGKYVHEKAPTEYVKLHADGTFENYERGDGTIGTYEIEGNTITLKASSGKEAVGKILENVLIDPDGDRWVKD